MRPEATPAPAVPALVPEPRDGYVFDNHSPHSGDQHRFLSESLDPITLGRLGDAGVGPGHHCLEIGAGGGSVAHWLADRVAPGGSVTATDVKPDLVPARAGLTVLAHDVVTDPLPESAYDVVVARLVLQHLPQRLAVLGKLVRSLKPGGLLQIDEFDTSYEPWLLAPSEEDGKLYQRFLDTKSDLMRAGGGDPTWGRQAAAAMRDAGLTGVDPRPFIQLRTPGSAALGLQLHHTHHLEPRLLRAGFSHAELRRLRDVMRHPDFAATSSVVYSVQGRKPAADSRREAL